MQGRVNKTEYFLSDREGFLKQLKEEVEKAIKKNEGKAIVTFRFNGTSDVVWEKFKVFEGGKNIFELFPNVQFYDYTKNHKRFEKELPSNYHLTFSKSESNNNEIKELLTTAFNIAVVFNGGLPKTYLNRPVIDGDISDLRFLEPKGVIVGLATKGNAKTDKTGFVVNVK